MSLFFLYLQVAFLWSSHIKPYLSDPPQHLPLINRDISGVTANSLESTQYCWESLPRCPVFECLLLKFQEPYSVLYPFLKPPFNLPILQLCYFLFLFFGGWGEFPMFLFLFSHYLFLGGIFIHTCALENQLPAGISRTILQALEHMTHFIPDMFT